MKLDRADRAALLQAATYLAIGLAACLLLLLGALVLGEAVHLFRLLGGV